jgi:hypothetical protein
VIRADPCGSAPPSTTSDAERRPFTTNSTANVAVQPTNSQDVVLYSNTEPTVRSNTYASAPMSNCDANCLRNRGKTRLAKWYVPYSDDEKIKLKGEVRAPSHLPSLSPFSHFLPLT